VSFNAEVLEGAEKLKLIQLLHAGYDAIDLGPPSALGVPVANCGDANAAAVAEHTVGLLLAVQRKLVQADAAFRAGADWRDHSAFDLSGYRDVFESRVGIIGNERDLDIVHVSLEALLEWRVRRDVAADFRLCLAECRRRARRQHAARNRQRVALRQPQPLIDLTNAASSSCRATNTGAANARSR